MIIIIGIGFVAFLILLVSALRKKPPVLPPPVHDPRKDIYKAHKYET